MAEGTMQLKIQFDRPIAKRSGPSAFDMAIEISCGSAPQGQRNASRINLCLVIDCSASMEGPKLQTAVKCADQIAQRLTPDDRLIVVSFSDKAKVIYNPDMPRSEASQRIRSLTTQGQTNLAGGWRLGLLELETHGHSEYFNRLILISDGAANIGETKETVLAAESRRASDMGISTTTIGVGNDFEEKLLYSLAMASGGNFWFVEESKLSTIIDHEFGKAISIQYINASLELVLPKGVVISDAMNGLRKIEQQTFRLPPLEAGQARNFAWRLRISPAEVADAELLEIMARVREGGQTIAEDTARLRLGTDQEYTGAPVNDTVVFSIQQFLLAKAEEGAAEVADSGNMNAMRARLGGIVGAMDEVRAGMRAGRRTEQLEEEMRQLRDLEQLAKILSSIEAEVKGSAFREWLRVDAAPTLQKLMLHRANKHHVRGMGAEIGDDSHQHTIETIRRKLSLLLESEMHMSPQNQAIREALQTLQAGRGT